MAIKAGSLLELMLMNSAINVRIGRLILEYATIKQKLDNPDEQSWYFQKGIESNRKKLMELQKSFSSYQDNFNSNTVDELIASKKSFHTRLEYATTRHSLFIRSMVVSRFIASINYADELLLLKSKIDWLQDIDFYLANSNELNKLLEI